MKKIACATLLLLALAGCKEKTKETKMASPKIETHTVCMGRQQLEMPTSFVLAEETNGMFKLLDMGSKDPAIEVAVHAATLDASGFAAALGQRHAELSKPDSLGMDVLRLEKNLSPEATLYRVQRVDDAYVSEINFLAGGNLVRASLKSFHDKFLNAEEKLVAFTQRVTVHKSSGNPAGGFCLGQVTLSGDFTAESVSALYQSTEHKGTVFNLEIDSFAPDESVSLFDRMSGPDSLLTKFKADVKVLRKRELTISGMHAQEWLGSILLGEHQDEKKFGFAMETMRPAPGKLTPRMHLSFDTGQQLPDGSVDSFVMPDAQAVALWDSVVSSIQPAP